MPSERDVKRKRCELKEPRGRNAERRDVIERESKGKKGQEKEMPRNRVVKR